MFSLFQRHAAASATCGEPATMTGMPMQAVNEDIADTVRVESGNEAASAEQPATYEELLPYLMLAMVSAI
jgi:hypothetical protein